MSVERFVKRQVATAAEVAAGNAYTGQAALADFDRWPAVIVPASGSYQIYSGVDAADKTAFDAAIGAVDGTDEVWFPEATPMAGGTELVIGRDYDVIVMQGTSKNAVFRLDVPAPTLTAPATLDPAVTTEVALSWTSAFNVSTKVYRTALYTTGGTVPSDFNLITEVDPVTTPATNAAYTDDVSGAASGQSVSYFVRNENGTSNTVEVDFVTV